MKRKWIPFICAATLLPASLAVRADTVEMDYAALSELRGQGLISLTVALAEKQKHDAMLDVARVLNLGREKHETREAIIRTAVLLMVAVDL